MLYVLTASKEAEEAGVRCSQSLHCCCIELEMYLKKIPESLIFKLVTKMNKQISHT